jgi:leader peptidase (prepilin peptidase)/N-methyltransferase
MIYILLFIFGAVIGSFLNVCIVRIPKEESVVYPNSKCPHCNRAIKFYDNIPIISYFLLRAKCRFCKKPISPVYPIVEVMTALAAIIIYLKFNDPIEFATIFYLTCSLIVISGIDIPYRIIPNSLSYSGACVGVILSFFRDSITVKESLLGLVLGLGLVFIISYVYFLITKREGMGGGDVKLTGLIGAFLGYKAVLPVLLIASILGSIVGLVVIFIKGKNLKYAIPFGPFLALGTIIIIFLKEYLPRLLDF